MVGKRKSQFDLNRDLIEEMPVHNEVDGTLTEVHRLTNVVLTRREGKGNVDLYSAYSRTSLTHSDMNYTVLPANNTISA